MSNFQMSDVRFRYFRRLYLTTSFLAQKQNPKKKQNTSTNLRKDRQQFCFISRITYLQIKTLDIKLKVKPPKKKKSKKNKEKTEIGNDWILIIHSCSLRTSTGVINDKRSNILISTPENQVTNCETKHNSHEHPTVKRHDGEHKQVPDPGIEPKEGGSGEPGGGPLGSGGLSVDLLQQRVLDLGFRRIGGFGGGEELETHALVFKVLVKGRDEETSEKGKGVTDPGTGRPTVEQDRHLLPPVKRHVHHLLFLRSDLFFSFFSFF